MVPCWEAGSASDPASTDPTQTRISKARSDPIDVESR